MSKKAFTLIELLVVIAIIAILAAILFPVFAQARESAKSTVCLSNSKQIALSTIMYTDDNDDMNPMGMSLSASRVLSFVHDGTANYRKSADILKCPSYPTANGGQDYTGVHGGSMAGSLLESIRARVGGTITMANTFRYNAYTWNIGVFGMRTGTPLVPSVYPYSGGTQPMNLGGSEIPLPAETIAFTDGYFPRRYNTTESLSGWVNYWYKWEIWPRHRAGMILSFMDGHAKFHRNSALPTGGRVVDSCPGFSSPTGQSTYYAWTNRLSQTVLNNCNIKDKNPSSERHFECVPHPTGYRANFGDIHGVPGTCYSDFKL